MTENRDTRWRQNTEEGGSRKQFPGPEMRGQWPEAGEARNRWSLSVPERKWPQRRQTPSLQMERLNFCVFSYWVWASIFFYNSLKKNKCSIFFSFAVVLAWLTGVREEPEEKLSAYVYARQIIEIRTLQIMINYLHTESIIKAKYRNKYITISCGERESNYLKLNSSWHH